MALALALIGLSLIGLLMGIRNQNKVLIRNSIIALIVIGILMILYGVLYTLNPY